MFDAVRDGGQHVAGLCLAFDRRGFRIERGGGLSIGVVDDNGIEPVQQRCKRGLQAQPRGSHVFGADVAYFGDVIVIELGERGVHAPRPFHGPAESAGVVSSADQVGQRLGHGFQRGPVQLAGLPR